jgi:hypothetical protein
MVSLINNARFGRLIRNVLSLTKRVHNKNMALFNTNRKQLNILPQQMGPALSISNLIATRLDRAGFSREYVPEYEAFSQDHN